MIIGVPREVKTAEFRVALTPVGIRELTAHGHTVLVERDAGEGSTIHDEEYEEQGASIAHDSEDVFAEADLIVKVKEPQAPELAMLRDGQILFTYLHLAAYPDVAKGLLARDLTAIAYETVELPGGSLPLLAPMSEVAGRMATQVGAHFLERAAGGRGILLGGIPGVRPAKVVVIGAGTSGSNAAAIAVGMQGHVTVLDRNLAKLRALDAHYQGELVTMASNRLTLEELVIDADLVIGSVLIPGASAPRLVSEDMVRSMRRGAVLVDISIDQGGCFETSWETTHDDPVYAVHDVVHYAVGNIPGAVPHTSTYGLTNATLPYLTAIADHGVQGSIERHPELARGVNVHRGSITHEAVADSLGLPHVPLDDALAA